MKGLRPAAYNLITRPRRIGVGDVKHVRHGVLEAGIDDTELTSIRAKSNIPAAGYVAIQEHILQAVVAELLISVHIAGLDFAVLKSAFATLARVVGHGAITPVDAVIHLVIAVNDAAGKHDLLHAGCVGQLAIQVAVHID